MALPTLKVPGRLPAPERDPNCEMCQHDWFTPHIHKDGTGRCMSSDNRTVYVQTIGPEGIATCTCPNGQHSEGVEPRCYHVRNFRTIRIDVRNGARKVPPAPAPKLEDLY